jgi:hypothetical protein
MLVTFESLCVFDRVLNLYEKNETNILIEECFKKFAARECLQVMVIKEIILIQLQ